MHNPFSPFYADIKSKLDYIGHKWPLPVITIARSLQTEQVDGDRLAINPEQVCLKGPFVNYVSKFLTIFDQLSTPLKHKVGDSRAYKQIWIA